MSVANRMETQFTSVRRTKIVMMSFNKNLTYSAVKPQAPELSQGVVRNQ
jgi:hypothetical protein